MPMPRLIGITGKAGAGKDTIAAHLAAEYGYVKIAFAAPLRRALIAMFDLHPKSFDRPAKEMPLPDIGKSPRELMQTLGTEWGRQLVHRDLWLILARKDVQRYLAMRRSVVITDVRFENEAALVRGMGGTVWHVERTGVSTPHAHQSEGGIGFVSGVDIFMPNNDAIADLHRSVDHQMAGTA